MQKKIQIKPTNQVRDAQAFIDDWVNKPMTGVKDQRFELPAQAQSLSVMEKSEEEPQFRFTFVLPTYLHRRIKKTCAAEGVSIKDKLTGILLEHFPEM